MLKIATSQNATKKKKRVKKFIQKVVKSPKFRKGALRKKLGVKGEKKITISMLNKKIATMKKKSVKGKMAATDLRTMREMVFAKNMMTSKGKGRKKK